MSNSKRGVNGGAAKAGVECLLQIHSEIKRASQGYELPWPLLTLVDEESLGYLQNKGGVSFYYQWLALLVRSVRPTLVLELGSGFGVSAIMMSSELSGTARLVSCDVVSRLKCVPPVVAEDRRLNFYCGNDLDLTTFHDELPVGIDVLFIDTEHTFDQVSAEWRIYRHLCNPGAIVALDDIKMNDMARFWESLPYPKLELTEECHVSGFGVFQYSPGDQPDPMKAYREALQIAWERSRNAERDKAERAAGLRAVWTGLRRRPGRKG